MGTTASQQLDAVYEGGVFRPLGPTQLVDGTRVHLVVEPASVTLTSDPLDLLIGVYSGLTAGEVSEIEAIVLDRSRFMSPVSIP